MPSKKKKYNARFPPARIKKIMQTDEEIGKVAAAVPVIISRALELFLDSLLTKACRVTGARNAKTMTASHLKQCIDGETQFDFLKDLVAAVPDVAPTQTPAEKDPSSSSSSHHRGGAEGQGATKDKAAQGRDKANKVRGRRGRKPGSGRKKGGEGAGTGGEGVPKVLKGKRKRPRGSADSERHHDDGDSEDDETTDREEGVAVGFQSSDEPPSSSMYPHVDNTEPLEGEGAIITAHSEVLCPSLP